MWRARLVWRTNELRADRGVLTLRGWGHLSGAAAGVSPESFWCPLACQTAQDQVCSESQVNLGPLRKTLFRNMRCFPSLMAWWKSVHMHHKGNRPSDSAKTAFHENWLNKCNCKIEANPKKNHQNMKSTSDQDAPQLKRCSLVWAEIQPWRAVLFLSNCPVFSLVLLRSPVDEKPWSITA